MTEVPREFDFALSYAGEDRDYVNGIAEALRDRGARVFYDQFMAPDLWGVDLYSRFDEVYRDQSMYVVAFISRHYVSKPWPMHERQSYQARMLEQRLPYFLPIRLDDSPMPGLRPTLGYIDANMHTPAAIVDMLLGKLGDREIPATQVNIVKVPRTREEQTELLSVRPECWALLYFGSELLLQRDALRVKFLDHEIGYAERRGSQLSATAAASFLAEALHQVQEVAPRLVALFHPEVQGKALGGTSLSGDPDRIAHLASRIIGVYGSILDWAARIRSVRAPDEMDRAFQLAAQLVDSSVRSIHDWVAAYVTDVESVKTRYDAGEEINQSLTLTLDIDETVLAQFLAEMERLTPRRRRWFGA